MAYDFSANEVFQMAIQMEKNGAAFYRKAAEAAADEKNKKFLQELADMEVEHERTFTDLRQQLTEQERAATVFDPEGEAAMYLKALVDTRVFFEKDIDVTSMRDILMAAIEAEKDSIVFYLGMKDAVPDDLGKSRLDAIIREEMGHVRLLSRKLVQFKIPKRELEALRRQKG